MSAPDPTLTTMRVRRADAAELEARWPEVPAAERLQALLESKCEDGWSHLHQEILELREALAEAVEEIGRLRPGPGQHPPLEQVAVVAPTPARHSEPGEYQRCRCDGLETVGSWHERACHNWRDGIAAP